MVNRPFKKDLTPIGRGGIRKFTGKGGREQARGGLGGPESLTGGSMLGSLGNNYPKPMPEAAPEPGGMPPLPMGQAPPRFPTAMMPGGGATDDDEVA